MINIIMWRKLIVHAVLDNSYNSQLYTFEGKR